MIEAIVFDLDDTLYLERDFVSSGFAAVGAWLERHHGIPGFAAAAEAVFDAGERRCVFDRVLRRFGAPASLVAPMLDVYRDHAPSIALAPDARAFLARNATRRLAILTDGYRQTQRNKIAALGLDRAGIDPIVCTDRWGRSFWKPHRRGFEHIQQAIGLAPDRFVYVADNPVKDFVAPRALGWYSVQLVRPRGVHAADVPGAVAADCAITTLNDLDDVLAEFDDRPLPAMAAR